MNKGRIIKIVSNQYTVLTEEETVVCRIRGKFRQANITPMVGDLVIFSNELVITNILPRKNMLTRPFISNVDQAVIVISVKEPEFQDYLLDKLLVLIEYHNIKPFICFTKIDLLKEKKQFFEIKKYYQQLGYSVYTNENLAIKKIFKNNVTVLAGQTGAGKSSLLNKLDSNLKIKTDEISTALGRGKHTTRHVELYLLYGGLVADTPGFSALSFLEMQRSDIRDNFIEFQKHRDQCRYRDCFHTNEDECHIKELVQQNKILKSRYENYLKFLKEVKK